MKKALAIILVLIFALSLTACGETYTLEGKWKAPASVLGYSTAFPSDCYVLLEFKADGTGATTTVNLAPLYSDDFTYTINGGTMTVTAENGEVVECEYEIKGSTLAIETESGTVEYTRVTD